MDSIGEEMVILFSFPERFTPSWLQVIVGAGTPLAVQLRDMSAVSFTDKEESIPESVIIAGAGVKKHSDNIWSITKTNIEKAAETIISYIEKVATISNIICHCQSLNN